MTLTYFLLLGGFFARLIFSGGGFVGGIPEGRSGVDRGSDLGFARLIEGCGGSPGGCCDISDGSNLGGGVKLIFFGLDPDADVNIPLALQWFCKSSCKDLIQLDVHCTVS